VTSTPGGNSWRRPSGEKGVWMLRITRTRLWILAAVALLLVGGIIGGAVGGTLAAKNKNDSASSAAAGSTVYECPFLFVRALCVPIHALTLLGCI
jgi:hypothetical protein